MEINRIFTQDLKGKNIFDSLKWKKFNVQLKDHRSNNILYELNDIEAPAHWSQQTVDIMASKYFRRSGIPFKTKSSYALPQGLEEIAGKISNYPEWILPSISDDEPDTDTVGHGETSVKQVFNRLAGAWTYWGCLKGYFNNEDNEPCEEYAQAFYDEIVYMLYHQMAAPNSPQFFNTGIWWAYGIKGNPCGHCYATDDGTVNKSPDLYSRSQAHACFILGLEDNLLDEGGIYDLLRKEARIFKLGSGAGTNFSNLRADGEMLSGGGTSSGLMSFLRIFDRAADCIKSGGICLCADTKIPTEEGVFTIQQLAEAEFSPRVYSWDKDTSQTVLRPVKEVFQSEDKECVNVKFTDGQEYNVSFDHPFLLTSGEYVKAFKLEKGNKCRGYGEINECIVSLVSPIGVQPTYNLSVDNEEEDKQNFAVVCIIDKPINKEGQTRYLHGVFTHNTRRAAKMLVVDVDHPDIMEYVKWKSQEEKKAKALIAAGYESDFNGEAYKTVSGQNGNNSVAVSHEFMEALEDGEVWDTWWRLDKKQFTDELGNVDYEKLNDLCKPAKSYKASEIWEEMILSAWKCADPAIHFNSTMNDWNTLAADGRIYSTNPCLAGDTLVYVVNEKDKVKKVKIKNIKSKTVKVLSCDDKGNVVVAKAHNLGVTRRNAKLVIIKTNKGKLKLTPDHEVYTNNGWVRAKELTEEIIYTLNKNLKIKQSKIIEVNEISNTEDVYDLNVPKHHNFFTDQMLVSNCSEYISLNDTACNLASINLAKFFDIKSQTFNVDNYKHAIRMWQIVLDLTNDMAQLPSEAVAHNVWKYRNTGLGPANLGTLLMLMGQPYDSEVSMNIAAALMSIMTGHSYTTSAEIAEHLGAFPAYDRNREYILKAIRNHRRAAYGLHEDMEPLSRRDVVKKVGEYEKLKIKPLPLLDKDHYSSKTKELFKAAKECWDEAISMGGSFGYRNGQVTVAAPTGTISLIMGCDSTGIEPCYALVTYKTLAGGGMMKLVNNCISDSLKNLGYTQDQIDSICNDIQEKGHVKGSAIKSQHVDIFKCAASPLGEEGTIHWKGHIKMLAALQSFVSGGISKTINMPESSTTDDISEAFKMGYKLGCKGISIYRDNCKASAPLAIKQNGDISINSEELITRLTNNDLFNEMARRKNENAIDIVHVLETLGITNQDIVEARRNWGQRRRPGDLLRGLRFRIKIGQAQGYLQIFLYPDGRICEFFLTFGNPGSSLNNMLECWSIAFSIALQRGESLGNLCSKFINVEFEPKGFTGRKDELRRVTSPVDYIARLMLMHFDDEGYLKDPSIFKEFQLPQEQEKKQKEEHKPKKQQKVIEPQQNDDNINDNTLSSMIRPACPQCGAIMTDGTDKCPTCPSCGYFGGCG